MEAPADFVEEIDFNELEFLEVVGRGAFGVVSRARWRGVDVAVKLIETESEKKAFITELKQLSRVSHPNIVQLYGACTKQPVCLVMEYAEGGSLYNVLHGEGCQPEYSAAHAISWALQCARGVEYLHSMKPKPLIHRDLKPPNLLLIDGGKLLKICDFGTACDAHTHMTNNKGSAAWMAPEVFEGNNYSEKCDVFSWGIIIWEVITRRKPFDEIGGPAFRIMWAVHNGTRPPLIKNCPKSIQTLMTKCWSASPMERPSMAEVVRIMTIVSEKFKGTVGPLHYPNQDEEDSTTAHPSRGISSVYDTPPPSNQSSHIMTGTPNTHTIRDTVLNCMGEPVPVPIAIQPRKKPVVIEEDRRTSAPASLAASRESLLDKSSRSSTPIDIVNKRYSADLTKLEELDISGHGQGTNQSSKAERGHRRTGSYGNSPLVSEDTSITTPIKQPAEDVLTHAETAPAELNSGPWIQNPLFPPNQLSTVRGGEQAAWHMALVAMDHQFQPLAPCPSSPESMTIYNQHCKQATEYLRVQTEITLLKQRRQELERELQNRSTHQQNSLKLAEEYCQLVSENESLAGLRENLQKQLHTLKHGAQVR